MARSPLQSSIRRLTAVRRSIRALDRVLAEFAAATRNYSSAATVTATPRTRRRAQTSAKARAAWKLQGQYMGHMRQLKPAQKALVRALKAQSGTKAAIRKAQELAGRKAA